MISATFAAVLCVLVGFAIAHFMFRAIRK